MADAGWYDDQDPLYARWWDGTKWTEHRVLKSDYTASPPPPPQPSVPSQFAFASSPRPAAAAAPSRGTGAREAKADAKAASARAKAMRPWWKKKRFIIPIALVVIGGIAAAAGGGGDDDDGGGDDTVAREESRQGDELRAVGTSGTTSGFEVTLLTVEHPFQVGEFEPGPDPGNRLIGVELSIRNTTDERQTMSTLLGMEISDDTGQRFDIAFRGLNRPQLDGEAAPGETIRGWAVFEVPEASTGLELEVRGSLTAAGVRYDLGLG